MLRSFLIITALTAFSFAAGTVGAANPGKPPECSLSVTPRPGESCVSKSNSGRINSSSSLNADSGSKTVTRSLKWDVEVRIRENRPEKTELKAHYLGINDKNKIVQIGQETKALEFDKNGRARVELTSPTTRLTRTTSSSVRSGNSGFRTTKSTTKGERVTGCVLQLFADGRLVKSWTSDPRWSSEAKNESFSVDSLNRKSGRIGLR